MLFISLFVDFAFILLRPTEDVYDALPSSRSDTSMPSSCAPLPPSIGYKTTLNLTIRESDVFEEQDYTDPTPDQLYDVPRSVMLSHPPLPCTVQPTNIHQYINAGARSVEPVKSQNANKQAVLSKKVPRAESSVVPECADPKASNSPPSSQPLYVPMDQHQLHYMAMKKMTIGNPEYPLGVYDSASTALVKQRFEGTVRSGM